MFGITFVGHPDLGTSTCRASSRATRCARTSRCSPAMVKPWPGIVDVEPMPGEGDERRRRGDGDGRPTASEA